MLYNMHFFLLDKNQDSLIDCTQLSSMVQNTFDLFCCFHKQYWAVIGNNLESLEQLYNATQLCFENMNETQRTQRVWDILKSEKEFTNFKEENCLPTSPSHIGYICFWLFVFIATICGNLTVILAVKKISYMREYVGNLLLSSLAVADFCVAFFIIPIKIIFAYNNLHFYSAELCRFYITTDNALFSTSVTTLFFISIDRYMSLAYPYRYQKLVTLSRCKWLIYGIWIYGFMWGLFSNLNWHNPRENSIHVNENYLCVINNNKSYVTTVYIFVFYFPAFLMGIIYYKVLSIARLHARSISLSIPTNRPEAVIHETAINEGSLHISDSDPLSKSSTTKKTVNLRSIAYRKMAFKANITVFSVYGTFFLCWFPVSLFSMAVAYQYHIDMGSKTTSKWIYLVFVEVLPVFNSMLNPTIYAIMNKQFRQAYKTILMRLTIFFKFC